MDEETNWNELREEMKRLDYPENHSFDPETLTPEGKSIQRAHAVLDILKKETKVKGTILDIGCNKGWFAFAFGWFYVALEGRFSHIVGIDVNREFTTLAQRIVEAHKLFDKMCFCATRFEDFFSDKPFDILHFGQCNQYLFRDGVRRKENPLWFLVKAKTLAKNHILIDGAFDGDPSVEYDAKQDGWPPIVKRMATIEGYASQLRPEFRLIRYQWSGDGATRYMAIFERVR